MLFADLVQDRLDAAAQLAADTGADPKRIGTIVSDVSREDQVAAAADTAIDHSGNLLVNTAGLMIFKSIEEQTVEYRTVGRALCDGTDGAAVADPLGARLKASRRASA